MSCKDEEKEEKVDKESKLITLNDLAKSEAYVLLNEDEYKYIKTLTLTDDQWYSYNINSLTLHFHDMSYHFESGTNLYMDYDFRGKFEFTDTTITLFGMESVLGKETFEYKIHKVYKIMFGDYYDVIYSAQYEFVSDIYKPCYYAGIDELETLPDIVNGVDIGNTLSQIREKFGNPKTGDENVKILMYLLYKYLSQCDYSDTDNTVIINTGKLKLNRLSTFKCYNTQIYWYKDNKHVPNIEFKRLKPLQILKIFKKLFIDNADVIRGFESGFLIEKFDPIYISKDENVMIFAHVTYLSANYFIKLTFDSMRQKPVKIDVYPLIRPPFLSDSARNPIPYFKQVIVDGKMKTITSDGKVYKQRLNKKILKRVFNYLVVRGYCKTTPSDIIESLKEFNLHKFH